ncbi:MAG: DUF3299 domain-containing protein [Planctomycetota bacterium]
MSYLLALLLGLLLAAVPVQSSQNGDEKKEAKSESKQSEKPIGPRKTKPVSRPAPKPGKPKPVPKPGKAKSGNGKGKEDGVVLPVKTKDAGKKEEEVPIPEGATEDDIRAIRGANAMLKAEVRLVKILRKLKIKGKTDYLPFERIDSWIYEDGFKGMPEVIKKLDQKRVVMAGFMLPIDEVEDIKSFYLVKSLWSCCFGTPPDVNGLVRVEVNAKKGVAYHYDPIFVIGKFRLRKDMDEDYVVCIYTIEAEAVRLLDLGDK